MLKNLTYVPHFLLVVLALVSHGSAAAESERPNILFVFTDDHASHAISAYGSKINQTPNIDRLAREGMLFENCFCTNSICAPSRAVILTGKHSHINGVIDNRQNFDGSQQHVAKLLGAAGYQTAIIGKWHLKSEPTGFDFWRVLPGQGSYFNPVFRTPEGNITLEGYTTDLITDMALGWLQEGREKDEPFFLMYQHKAPHRDWQPGPEYLTMYDDTEIAEPDTLFDDYEGRTSAAKTQEMTVREHLTPRDLKLTPPRNLTPAQLKQWNAAYDPKNKQFQEANLEGEELIRWKYQRYMKDYLRCIASVDDNLGRVLDYLEESGLADNTVVIYSSDQGFYLGDHGWFDKRWMYEESLRMPFIVRWPGKVKPGQVDDHLVQNLDFAETFLNIAGVKIPDDMQGRSLVPLFEGKDPADWRDSIYYHYYEWPGAHMVQRHYGVRTDRYKLVYYYPIDEWELFDLQKDPEELQSVYEDGAYASVVQKLKAELKRLRKQYEVEGFNEPAWPKPKDDKLSMVLRYTFESADAQQAPNIAGGGHDGQISGTATVVQSPQPALELDGQGAITTNTTAELDPSMRAFAVGMWCSPQKKSGVLIAQGGESQGYSLYLHDGHPTFAIRSGGNLYTVQAADTLPADQWTHVAGAIDTRGQMTLIINGKPQSNTTTARLISSKPADGLSVGADTGSFVDEYKTPNHFSGSLRDVRVYWGAMTAEELANWAK